MSRAVAVLLCVQPMFWMSNVALAQAIQPPGGAAPSSLVPVGPTDPEVVRPERPVLTTAVPPPAAMDEPLDPNKYICGNGDVLELNFWGIQNFKLRVTIDLEGRAFVAKVGYFNLRGKTLTEARHVMRDSVARYYPRLSFDVTLAEPRTFLVQVVGDVVHPASYQARAIDRVATMITRAGGFGPSASKRRIEIRRLDGTVLSADLLLYTLTGDVKYNPFLLDGDAVRVPFEQLAASIGGAVNRPGRYELVATRDLAELVDLAGGLAPSATHLLPITVVRRSQDDRPDLKVFGFGPNGQLPAVTIQQEDTIRVPSASDLQQAVTVIGAVAAIAAPELPASRNPAPDAATTRSPPTDEATTTRRLPFVKGDTVRTLLDRVGGVGPLADLSGAYLIRNGQPLAVDLYALVMLREFKADRAVELGDTLVVPFMRRNVLVEGAVFAPGSYPYNPAFGIDQYLSLAGGPNRFAQPLSDVKVITPNGETKKYDPNLKIDPGSSLVVPERNFSRSEVVQILLGAAGIILSGVAVVIAARR